MSYDPKKIELKWQEIWEKTKVFDAQDFGKRDKFYMLFEFPYASGDGLHVGHVRAYTASDVIARYKRMLGLNVLFPIGWDAFGLPTENYAIKTKTHPRKVADRNITAFKEQVKRIGISVDWTREINTSDRSYYRWTQWIFLKLYNAGLAYQAEIPINWCPFEKVGLADEEVVAGKHERCGTLVTKRMVKQWLLKITEYADRLIKDLDMVDYPERVKAQQINWVGRSEGVEIDFKIDLSSSRKLGSDPRVEPEDDSNGKDDIIKVFTTRPDTLYGATYMVLAPEHPLVDVILRQAQDEKIKKSVQKYVDAAKNKSELERQQEEKEKTGVFIGAFAVNPANNEKIPVWIADYVLPGYGTGAIMAVPAYDERDLDFAKKYKLPVNKAPLTKKKFGEKKINYRLRDWVFSRQHYWGEPIPIIHCSNCGIVPVPEDELPVELPDVEHYEPTDTGASPLAAIKEWVNVKCPKCAGPAKRETDTMPNWAGSSWYFLRYIDPKNDKVFADRKKLDYWMQVDLYEGGMEHTTLHLLYSRFWHKFLYDQGFVRDGEPYAKRRSHGIVLGADNRKMSKSFGNVVNPDEVIAKHGADTLRIYEMFIGPFDQEVAWNPKSIAGVHRFLSRVHQQAQIIMNLPDVDRAVATDSGRDIAAAGLERTAARAVKKVTEDIENLHFNTAIAALMEFSNEIKAKLEFAADSPIEFKEAIKVLGLLLSPFAPHLAEELWNNMGNYESISLAEWPSLDESLLEDDLITIPVQVNGKVRAEIAFANDTSESKIIRLAKENADVARHLEGRQIVKEIYVSGRIVTIATK